MGRPTALLKPRAVTVNGLARFEVRVPAEIRKQENVTRRFFAKEAEAKVYCARLASDLRNYSDKARGLTDEQKIAAQEAFARLAEVPGASLPAAVEMYLAHLEQTNRSVTLANLGEQLLAERQSLTGRGAAGGTIGEIKGIWGRFVRDHPDRMANTITSEEIYAWLVTLTKLDPNGRHSGTLVDTGVPVSLQTRRNHRRVLSAVFGWAAHHARRWVPVNPVTPVRLPTLVRKRVSLLTPEQTAHLLGAAVPEIRPFLAICAFAGARPQQAQGICWEQIHLDRREIEVPAGSDKQDNERIVPIQDNLAAWLGQVPAELRSGPIFHSVAWFRRATADAGLRPWEQDCLRHGYCSYRFKITGSFGTVADEAGNSEGVIRDRYYRSLSLATAKAYFALMPPPLPAGYAYHQTLGRWNMAAAMAARVMVAGRALSQGALRKPVKRSSSRLEECA